MAKIPGFKQTTLYLMLTAIVAVAPLLADADDNNIDPELKKQLATALANTTEVYDRFDAEVWLTDMSSRLKDLVTDPIERSEILKHIYIEALRLQLEPELVLAVIYVESRFDRFAISNSGARGLMQVMPFWLEEIGQGNDNLFNIKTNLRFGCTILKYYLDKESGDTVPALARYNGSYGSSRYPDKVLNAYHELWH